MIDTEKSSLGTVLSTGFDRGMIIFILGAAHQLLLSFPNIQMFALIGIEFLWMGKKIVAKKYYINSLFFIISLMESLLRLYLQVSSLFYT